MTKYMIVRVDKGLSYFTGRKTKGVVVDAQLKDMYEVSEPEFMTRICRARKYSTRSSAVRALKKINVSCNVMLVVMPCYMNEEGVNNE